MFTSRSCELNTVLRWSGNRGRKKYSNRIQLRCVTRRGVSSEGMERERRLLKGDTGKTPGRLSTSEAPCSQSGTTPEPLGRPDRGPLGRPSRARREARARGDSPAPGAPRPPSPQGQRRSPARGAQRGLGMLRRGRAGGPQDGVTESPVPVRGGAPA